MKENSNGGASLLGSRNNNNVFVLYSEAREREEMTLGRNR